MIDVQLDLKKKLFCIIEVDGQIDTQLRGL